MIIIISMVIGYILGILPILYPEIMKHLKCSEKNIQEPLNNKDTSKIIDEWLNGTAVEKKETENNVNNVTPEEVYREYMTGVETKYGE